MFSELRKATAEKFCNYLGENTCSTLSKHGSAAINSLSSPIALATIGAIGLTTTLLIHWKWNTTVVERVIKKEADPVIPPSGPVAQINEPDSFPELPAPVVAPAAPVAQINKPDSFPELTAPTLTITQMYYEKQNTPILGPKKIWVEGEAPYQVSVKPIAPYLLGDLRMGDGSEIPLEEGDYLIMVELNDSNKSGQCERYYYLPALLVRRLRPNLPLILQYKNEQKTLKISEDLFTVLNQTLKNFERAYYPQQFGGLANEPIPFTSIGDFYVQQAKRYFGPPK